MKYIRTNTKTKNQYYQLFALADILALVLLYIYTPIHWVFILLFTPLLLLDFWSNLRCARRQKHPINEIHISDKNITCIFSNGNTQVIPHSEGKFSIREVKFEKEKTEIEVRQKKRIKSQLIGRLHIKNWENIFEIKNSLLEHKYTQIKYRPEGYWSKYGTLTADTIITGTAFTISAAADIQGDHGLASDLRSDLFMPLSDLQKSDKEKKE